MERSGAFPSFIDLSWELFGSLKKSAKFQKNWIILKGWNRHFCWQLVVGGAIVWFLYFHFRNKRVWPAWKFCWFRGHGKVSSILGSMVFAVFKTFKPSLDFANASVLVLCFYNLPTWSYNHWQFVFIQWARFSKRVYNNPKGLIIPIQYTSDYLGASILQLTRSWFPANCHQLVVRPCQSRLSWYCSAHPGEGSLASGLCDWT